MSQVHKEQLSAVDNALPNRSSLDVEIFGMEGVPEDIIQSHNQRVATQFQQAEAERQAVTGNPPPGTGVGGQPAKKPKLESVSDLKKRLAEHKAKKAEARTGGSSGEATPVGAGQTPTMGGFVSILSHNISDVTNNEAGPACSCCCRARRCTHHYLTVLLPSTLRHRLSLSSNRQPCLSQFLPGTTPIPSNRTIPSGGIFTTAVPGYAGGIVWNHTSGIPSTTVSNPHPSADGWGIPAPVG